ncbi:MAG: SDR family oxidoreductase [Candidatus Abyssobacteria bacterium SURF_5]|uniref:SDR family oxidoreductase n=1 Tax=Abyssobacteria bacterium (strain SURF_5) TaxID=2093360 RepID=A0A3A4NVP3_ABYX5|nr:MAG: SDR family oxidoreductase [Candidatus Abyssubacteria bacterium SURF_5]
MGFFTEKIALITGGASGIGRAVATELARQGAVVVLADVNERLLEEAVESIRRAGFRAESFRLDVADPEAFQALVASVREKHGRLDYLFNNAGIAVVGETRSFSYEDWRSVIDVDLYGVVNGVAAAYPLMVKQGFGHIVNTASLAGLVPVPGEISYTASKYGVVGLSHVLRQEGDGYGVKVSVVCPGFIETPILYNSKIVGLDREKVLEKIPETMPADVCARAILNGVERNQATIVITRMAKILWMLHRISPSLMMWLGKRFARDVRNLARPAAAPQI